MILFQNVTKAYDEFGRNIASALDNSTKAVYTYDVAALKISAMSAFNTNFGFNSMNNNNLQSKITCQCALNKTIVAANGNSLNSSTSNTLNNSITTTSNLPFNSSILTENIASINPFRFSSEYHDSTLGLVYYNYRHYNPTSGRWINRDPIAEEGGYSLYGLVDNNLINNIDIKGLIIQVGDPCSGLDPQKVKNTAGRIYNESASVSNCEGRSIDEIRIELGRIMQVNMKMVGPELKGKIDLKVYESCKNAACNAMKDKETKNTHFILHSETRHGEFSEETQDKYKFRHGHADDFSPLEDEHKKPLPCRLPNGKKGILRWDKPKEPAVITETIKCKDASGGSTYVRFHMKEPRKSRKKRCVPC